MLYEIFAFLIGTFTSIVVGACLLRVYMQATRIAFSNPVGQLVLTLTDWLVRPARQLARPAGRWDWLTLLLAYLLLALEATLLLALLAQWQWLPLVPLRALFALLNQGLWLAIVVLLGYVALSWLMPGHWLHSMTERLCQPWLAPLRRTLPAPGRIDFAPMVLSLLLYIGLIVLRRVEAGMLAGLL